MSRRNGLTPIAGLTHRLDLLDRLDLRPILPEIPTEVLVLHGTRPTGSYQWLATEELVAGLATLDGRSDGPELDTSRTGPIPSRAGRSAREFLDGLCL